MSKEGEGKDRTMHPFYTDDQDPEVRARAQGLLRIKTALEDTKARKRHGRRPRRRHPVSMKPPEEFDANPLTAVAPRLEATGYQYSHDAGPRQALRGKARWWAAIGPQPQCEGGQRWRAKLYHDAILAAMDGDEWLSWTRAEREQLRQLELRWRARASGLDVRFNVVGNKAGMLKPEERIAVRRARLERVGQP
jgi:hypothetical protein